MGTIYYYYYYFSILWSNLEVVQMEKSLVKEVVT